MPLQIRIGPRQVGGQIPGFRGCSRAAVHCEIFLAAGTNRAEGAYPMHGLTEEKRMPVILLWGIPTLIVVVGGGYWLMHVHH
jgi:hypothetical protein